MMRHHPTSQRGTRGLRIFGIVVAIATGLALSAASASAQYNIPMTGEWFQNRGPLVDIPVNGGPDLCPTGTLATGCLANFRPQNGGIDDAGGQSIGVLSPGSTPNDPARFTVPTSAFHQALGPQHTHVSIIPTVVQLDTNFSLNGPIAETGGPNVDRVFEKNAWSVQGHTGRLGLSFAWCPGVGGPNCPDPRPTLNGNTGAANGLIRYTNASGTGFGGTMAMLTATPPGDGRVWVVVGTAGGPMATPLLLRQNFGGSPARQHPGAGYAVTDTDMLATGPIYRGFMTSNQLPGQTGHLVGPMNGLITTLGSQVTTAPADNNTNWGFPWTTGTVFVQDIQTNMGAMATTTISEMGSDNRTQAGGSGNITLVAGGTSHRVGAVTDFKAFDHITMSLPEPGGVVALCGALAVIAGLYGRRTRR